MRRKPIVAGQFYPEDKKQCLIEIEEFATEVPEVTELEKVTSIIVPHAGWTFSGALATLAFNTVKKINGKVDTFVLFGAGHYPIALPQVYPSGWWDTPIGKSEVDAEFVELLLASDIEIDAGDSSHCNEHSIEVQVPILQYFFPEAKIVPMTMPTNHIAIEAGKAAGKITKTLTDKKIVFVGSSDLTHYGPRYGFNPMGNGNEAIKWSTEVNDQSFIDFALAMKPENMLADAKEKHNACGSGAASGVVQAAKELGIEKGVLLGHYNSNDVMKSKFNQESLEAVGYAAIAF